MSDFLRANGLWVLAGVIALAIALRHLLKRPGPRRRYDLMLLRLPIIGRLVRGINTARFTRTLSILAASGVQSLELSRSLRGELALVLTDVILPGINGKQFHTRITPFPCTA